MFRLNFSVSSELFCIFTSPHVEKFGASFRGHTPVSISLSHPEYPTRPRSRPATVHASKTGPRQLDSPATDSRPTEAKSQSAHAETRALDRLPATRSTSLHRGSGRSNVVHDSNI